jgi:hypothetical protein
MGGALAHMGRGEVHAMLCWENRGKGPLGKHRRRWEVNIKTYLSGIVWEFLDWIGLDLERDN